MLRTIAARLRDVLAFDRRLPPPTLGFQLVGGGHGGLFGQDGGDQDMDEDVYDVEQVDGQEENDDSRLFMAVPKRRVTRRRKRIKFAQKHLTPLKGFVTCPECSQQHPHYYQLCPFCKPFNNYIRAKDVPARGIDRLKRNIEVKLLDELVEKEKTKLQRVADAVKKHQENMAKQTAERAEDLDKGEKR
jgi:ribosomal protein L32